METSVINPVRRKKKSLLNIYKLMQADPKAQFFKIINLINLYLKSNLKNGARVIIFRLQLLFIKVKIFYCLNKKGVLTFVKEYDEKKNNTIKYISFFDLE
ncbi:hypothetical protein YYE_04579 [Plasmodium vinckei vinckei]|uniref:Uncharacterized protein n=1 Tax=Plasmodium vinckei vinckei TaxID=54757 RepID=A0A081I9N8_PLAVN|nr:hypothetical protein YYE_04579 [Plasmodium vinckei vinckei]